MAFPLILAAGAAAGGLLSAVGASSSNRAVKKQAKSAQESVNAELVQQREAYLDRNQTLTDNITGTIGQFKNSLNFGSGGSINAVIAQMYAEASKDSSILNRTMQNTEKSAGLQRQNIINQGNSQMQSVGLAAVQGGIQGAMTAASLYSAFQGFSQASAAKDVLSNPNSPAWKVDAVLKGVDPTLLNNVNVANILSGTFNTQQQLSNLAVQSARANAATATMNNNTAQQRLRGF